MSTPPPDSPWGQPAQPGSQPPATPPAGQWAQPAPTAAQPQPAGTTPGGGGNGKTIGIVVGVIAVVAALVVGGFALFGGDDGGPRSTTSDDPDEAVAVAEDAVAAVLDGDCDEAGEFATRQFRDQLDSLCDEPYPDSKITDSSLENDDPVVVLVEFEVQDNELSYPLTMEYDEDEEMWFVDSLEGIPEIDDPVDEPTDPTDEPTDPTDEPTDPTDEPTDEGDLDDAVDVATNLVQALIDQDCDLAATYATDEFATDEIDGSCEEDPGTIEITDATVTSEDPVIVEVEYAGDFEGTFPFEMVREDGEWLVADINIGTDGPSASSTPATGGELPDDADPQDAVAVAETAMEALAAGDCDTALSYGTAFFQDIHGEFVCDALPAGAEITGAELVSEDPVIVSVDTDAGFGIELYLVYEDGEWLVDDYAV